jgi:glyoxylase-like metal-dependent hydrolase (beta-lactamase superfamily II)
MVDAPRWTRAVVDALAARDGLAAILLTHRDDVADAGRYAAHFSANVWIHRADGDAAPFATHVLDGVEPQPIADDLVAIPVPGHTEGSTVYLYRHRWLFTGDSLAWSFERNDLIAFRDACWFSWRAQRKSLERLLDVPFEGVFAGHGGSHWLPAAEMRSRLIRLLRRMERQ